MNGIAGFNGLGGVISVSNSGFISGGSSGISGYNVTVTTNTGSTDTSIAGIAGISAVNSATVSNSNSGTIQGNGGASGIVVSAGNANVTNSGGIFGGLATHLASSVPASPWSIPIPASSQAATSASSRYHWVGLP